MFFFLLPQAGHQVSCEILLRAHWGYSHRHFCQSSYNLWCNSLQGLIFSVLYLRASNIIIEDQARKLSQLTQKLQQGRDVSLVLSQHLQDLLTQDPGSDQGQGFQEQLAEGCWIGECLVLKLSPGEVATGPEYTQLLEVPSSRTVQLQSDFCSCFGFHVKYRPCKSRTVCMETQNKRTTWSQSIYLLCPLLPDGSWPSMRRHIPPVSKQKVT